MYLGYRLATRRTRSVFKYQFQAGELYQRLKLEPEFEFQSQ